MTDPAAIEAGPALDALVAVQVMGWTRLPDWVDGIVVHRLYRSPEAMETSWLPPFSTNIAHAWAVVERMVETGCKAWVERRPECDYACTFERTNDAGGIEFCAYGEGATAPLAICRAALSATSER